MFKTAATKLAHNSTLPSLGGHSDLRSLQDLITAEKAVLISMQKLSVDLNKSAEALRAWGIGEGDDLGDTLSASTTILSSFSSALSQYATHEHAIRDHMKSIRSREEALDELKRRRKAVVTKAEAADKKLSKMSPEHKNLAMQTEILSRLRAEIRVMDSDIMTEEAALGDFKRTTTRSMLGLKFGGLLEFSEKGTIIGEYGKLIVAEIPEDVTQPGMPRHMYNNHNRVESLVSEAYKCVNDVGFSTVPSRPGDKHFEPPSLPETPSSPSYADYPRDSNGGFLPAPQGIGSGHFLDSTDGSTSLTSPSSPATPSKYEFAPPAGPPPQQFAPPAGPPPQHQYPAPDGPPPQQHQFSSPPPTIPMLPGESKLRAMDDFGLMNKESSEASAGRFATFPVNNPQRGFGHDRAPSITTHPVSEQEESFSSSIASALKLPGDEPAPSYEVSHSHLYDAPPGPPPGAGLAADHKVDPWRVSAAPSDDDIGLAYDAHHEEQPSTSSHARQDSATRNNMVRFGSVRDIDEEIQKRHSEEEHHRNDPVPKASPSRVPPPQLSPGDEEREANAAAAREVSRELDALSFSPPPGPAPRTLSQSPERSRSPPPTTPIGGDQPPQVKVSALSVSSRSPTSPTSPIHREPSPLIPPSAPFHDELADVDPPTPTAAQSYAQAHRKSGSFPNNFDTPASPLAAAPSVASHSDNYEPPTLPVGDSGYTSSPTSDIRGFPTPPSETRALPQPHSPLTERPPLPQLEGRPLPPQLNFGDRNSSFGTPSASYRTPPEYPAPRPAFASSGRSASSTSVNSVGTGAPAGGIRTISAAAFRRPPPRMASNGSGDFSASGGVPGPADTSPLAFKKRLPSSPYPSGPRLVPTSSLPRGSEPPPASRDSIARSDGEDDDFDYIGAYTQDSPKQETFGNKMNRASGYEQGRFATNLDSETLR